MRWPRGVRARLAGALVLLVAVTAVVLGVGASIFVDARLHRPGAPGCRGPGPFDLTVTVPGRQLPDEPTLDDIIRSGLTDTFRQRDVGSVIDLGDGETCQIERHPGRPPRAAAARRPAAGRSRRARLRLDGRRRQAIARGRRAGAGWRAGGATSSATCRTIAAAVDQLRGVLLRGHGPAGRPGVADGPGRRARHPRADRGGRSHRRAASSAATCSRACR